MRGRGRSRVGSGPVCMETSKTRSGSSVQLERPLHRRTAPAPAPRRRASKTTLLLTDLKRRMLLMRNVTDGIVCESFGLGQAPDKREVTVEMNHGGGAYRNIVGADRKSLLRKRVGKRRHWACGRNTSHSRKGRRGGMEAGTGKNQTRITKEGRGPFLQLVEH